MNNQRCLSDIRPGEKATVSALRTEGSMRRRLLDIGLIENTDVECSDAARPGIPPYI